jgi:hypothetical protein
VVDEAEHPQDANQRGTNADKATDQYTDHSLPTPPPATNIENHDSQKPQGAGNQRGAHRFWDLSFSTITQLLAAIVLAGVGYLQYRVYSEQAGIMHGQLNATQDQLDQMRMQQRAFITASDYKVRRLTEHSQCWKFDPIISNTGETPTRDMQYIKEIVAVELPRPGEQGSANGMIFAPTDPENWFRKHAGGPGALLGPKQSLPDIVGGFSKVCLSYNNSGYIFANERIYARGVIHYKDVFHNSPEHITKYCFWIQAEENNGAYEPRIVLCSHWNCADRECDRDEKDYEAEVAEVFGKAGQTPEPPTEWFPQ